MYRNSIAVKDIFIEDFNGDGLKDFKILTYFSNIPDVYEFTWIYYQKEDGLFYIDEQETEQMLMEQPD